MNAIGEPIDGLGPISALTWSSIYRNAPDFPTNVDQLVTGIKAIDLLFPCMKGHKIGLIGEAATGQTTLISELIHNTAMRNGSRSVFVGFGEQRALRDIYNQMVA